MGTYFKNITYFNDDLYKLDETESYDIAYAHFVLHDIPNQELERVIQSLYKLLKNKGKLYIREPLEDTIKIDFMENILKQNGFIQSEKTEISIPLMGKSFEAIYIKN